MSTIQTYARISKKQDGHLLVNMAVEHKNS